jgi:hypothetical protein
MAVELEEKVGRAVVLGLMVLLKEEEVLLVMVPLPMVLLLLLPEVLLPPLPEVLVVSTTRVGRDGEGVYVSVTV